MRKGEDFTGVCVVFYCHDGSGNYLFGKRSSACRDEVGRWDPGGGGVKFGESVIDALHREVREEYSTEIVEYEFLGFRDVHRENEGKKTHWITLDYRVLVHPESVANGDPEKIEEICWCTLDNLPEPMHSQEVMCRTLYPDKLR